MSIESQPDSVSRDLGGAAAAFGRNLTAGFRLVLPLPAGYLRLHPTLGQLLGLILALWLLATVDDFIDAGFGAEFSPWGLLSQATQSYFWIATLALIVLVDRRASQFLLLAVAMAAVGVVLLIIWMITTNLWWRYDTESYDEFYYAMWTAFLLWELLAFARIMRTLYLAPWRRAALHTLAYGVAVYSILSYLPHRPMLVEPWQKPEEMSVDVEAAYYAQANLLSHSLHALSPQRAGTVDLYFVGFGAYAYQDVFKREIEQATVIFEQQFDAIGRSVSLINNLDTINVLPLANRHNLEKTIRDLAARIDVEEDVVVVFLSSHGAQDATISVELPGFGFNDLEAGEVRKMLDDSDIKWRIVIVSACYSGSFIETLASPTTLVMTAASADRSSFGCSHENEWTYFGEAYFEQALRQTPAFTAAFERAKEIIAKRESDEGKLPSNPQISVGSEIESYLDHHGL